MSDARVGLRRRSTSLWAAVVAAALVLSACGSNGSSDDSEGSFEVGSGPAVTSSPLNDIFGPGGPEGGQDVTVNDGMILALSGPGKVYGDAMLKAAELAAEQIKEAGGPTFVISTGDHNNGDPATGLSEYQRLVSGNQINMLQTSYGAPSEAIAPKLTGDKVLGFNGGGASPGQIGKPNLWMTRMIFVLDPTPGGLAWLAQNFADAKKLAVVGQKENGAEVQEQIVPKLWPELTGGDGSIVVNEYAPIGTTNFDSVVAKIKASGAEAVFTTTYSDDMGYFVKALREANVTVPVMGIDVSQNFFDVAGSSVTDVYAAAEQYDPENPSPFNQFFVKSWKDKYGEAPRDIYGANYYEMLFMWWQLVRRVIADGGNPNDTAALSKAFEDDPTFPSLYGGSADETGTMTFDVASHTVSKPMFVTKLNPDGSQEQLAEIQRIDYTSDDPFSAIVN